ncbi:hypothetical protein HYH02_003009 [Chlamydomonas schloesseri]|uniref:Uncharacterized protein n=1 Tax=Chlamydomonas schloesseri TaxID=2026947 RepID=A0A835WSV8_9CHLO|nr:hypothetical protein HYH02_003009 [Chlamydomonas schloesseri]|eukprot:KAG2452779.1 hypothetical protein HYH02_003009 [Chlamydomonas schloesseri]
MLGAQAEARPKAAAGAGGAGEAAGAASEYALLGADGGAHGDGGKAGNGGGGGRGDGGGHHGSHEESGFPRGAPLLLAALAALACAASLAANQLHLRKTQTSSQRQLVEPQRQLATRTRVLFGTTAGGSSSRVRRAGVPGGGSGLLGAWSSWLPRYSDAAAEGGSGPTEADEEALLATSRLVQAQPWSAGEPQHGFWRDERASGGSGLGGGSAWARQGLSQPGSGASSRQRSSGSGVDSIGAAAGMRLPTTAAAAASGPVLRAGAPSSTAGSWGPRDPRMDFTEEISRLGSARDGLHAAHGRAKQWLQEDAARPRGSSNRNTGAPGPAAAAMV